MKIILRGIYAQGPYYEVIRNGKTNYIYGFDNLKKLIEEAKRKNEEIELVESRGFEEHGKLIKLLEEK